MARTISGARGFAMVLGLLVIAGCTARDIHVADKQSFSASEHDGIVFFSARNPTDNGHFFRLYISHVDKVIDSNQQGGLQHLHPLQLSRRENGAFAYKAGLLDSGNPAETVVALQIPEGEYRIWSWSLDRYSPVGYPEEYRFKVVRHQVTYIGRFTLSLHTEDKRFSVSIENAYDEDRKDFERQHPGLILDKMPVSLIQRFR
jgi:hypothetical protein